MMMTKTAFLVALILNLGLTWMGEAFRNQPYRTTTTTLPAISIPTSTSLWASSDSLSSSNFKLLVLGGTGFVGREVIKRARQKGMTVVSLSRRGKLIGEKDESVTWVSGDASETKTVQAVIDDFGPFDGCVHAIGVLFDAETGIAALNRFASGSGSTPDSSSTYDRVIRGTAFTAIECLTEKSSTSVETPKPFVYVSSAEAGWKVTVPVPWLEKYLAAKRAVEDKVMTTKALRPVILRPSIIWTWQRPQALASVVPFFIASTLRIPGLDRPVLLSTLVDAAIGALQDPVVRGILRKKDMDAVAAKVTRIL